MINFRSNAISAALLRSALFGVVLTLLAAARSVAQSTNGVAPLSYDSFRTISDHNIFNPNRYARGSSRPVTRPSSQPASHVESISLVGIMAYDKGVYAFFDGTKSDYKQALQTGGVMGEYKIENIAQDTVTLARGTNTYVVKIGMQMRREDEGDWFLSEGGDTARKRIVSTRTRTRGSSRSGDGTSGGSGEDLTVGGEPEVIVLDADSQMGANSDQQFNTGNGSGEAAPAEAAADNGGVTDPVLLRLMQRRQQMNQ